MTDTAWYRLSTAEVTDINKVKDQLEIELDDITNDPMLDDYGVQANRKIDNLLFPYQDKIPEIDEDVTEELRGAAVLFIIYRYKQQIKSEDAAKSYKIEFKETINEVIERLKSIPEGRTDTVVVTNDYRSEPLRSRERFFNNA